MQLATRKLLDRTFTGVGLLAVGLVAVALVAMLGPIITRGLGAFVFQETIEHRRFLLERFGRGDRSEIEAEWAEAQVAREAIHGRITQFESELRKLDWDQRQQYAGPLRDLKDVLHELLGPFPDEPKPVMPRDQYGPTRWDRAQVALEHVLFIEEYDYSDPTQMGKKVLIPRANQFIGTSLAPLFGELETNLDKMLLPRRTFYWRFLFDESVDAHLFGGIWPEVLGTLYLTLGAIVFAVPMGVISAIYLVEYARPESRLVGLLRTCISTLAGVPSIVFGLFGLAFFINTVHVSQSKSVLAGSLTLAILILPLIIRASEEAIRAVPATYKEAALSLGAGRWRTVVTVLLPAALPGILTGIVISMGRAAGETAPIIFTAAVSVGQPLALWEAFSQPSPALPWNIYNLCTEHEAVDAIRHVQYGMVFALLALVLMLNGLAIVLRARIAKRLRG
ncbi:MAG: phosphate ABC transporter permease PstA [Phycisphaerae bacterium]|nr:phosphate ABC transporter permease PstA [Phycisphaerae bacterium]